MDITLVDPARIVIKKPKKYDKVYLGKMEYDRTKFDIMFNNVNIIESKLTGAHDTNLYIKMSNDQIDGLLRIEDEVIKNTVQNVHTWFKKQINLSLVEEYFQKNIIIDKQHGKVFKCKIETPLQEIALGCCNMVIRISSLRFDNKQYTLTWKIGSIDALLNNEYIFNDDLVDDDFCQEQDLSYLFYELRDDLQEKLSIHKTNINIQLNRYKEMENEFENLKCMSDIENLNKMMLAL